MVVRCLLQTKSIFDHSETRYHLSKLYLNDFCAWLQSTPGARKRLAELAAQVRAECEQLQMDDTGFDCSGVLAEAVGFSSSSSASSTSSDDDSSDDSSSLPTDSDDEGLKLSGNHEPAATPESKQLITVVGNG